MQIQTIKNKLEGSALTFISNALIQFRVRDNSVHPMQMRTNALKRGTRGEKDIFAPFVSRKARLTRRELCTRVARSNTKDQ